MRRLVVLASGAALLALTGCSSSDSNGGGNDGGTVRTFTPPFTPSSPQIDKSIRVTFSGETFGVEGLPYPGSCPSGGGEALFFVDGWSISFDEYLVVVDNLRLNATAGNAIQTDVGSLVASSRGGPWAVDMHKPSGFVGSDGESPAGALYLLTGPDQGGSFDPAVKYAFSYDVVQARSGVVNVNLTDAQVNGSLAQMISKGWSKFIKGTAVFAGTDGYPGGDPAVDAKFKAFPKTIHFTFGWDDHGSAINCNNPDFNLAEDDPAGRGIQVTPTGAVYAQITLHTDHVFWDQLIIHGTPLHFDQIAAWATPANSNPDTPLALDQLGKPLAATFADGTPLPDRGPVQPTSACYDGSFQPNPAQLTFHLSGSAGSVPSSVVKNLADFMAFSAQSQMHLNADGLCYNTGQHASDPFYVPGLPK
jgi:hypothetical protein